LNKNGGKQNMAKRKISKYNLHMKRQMAKGMSFRQAAKSWKK